MARKVGSAAGLAAAIVPSSATRIIKITLLFRRVTFLLGALAFALALLLIPSQVFIARAETARQRGDLEAASTALHSAAWLSPWRPVLWEQAAAAALVAGQPDQAIADIARLPVPSIDGSILLAAAHEQEGDLDSALRVYRQSLDVHGPTPSLLAGLADVLRKRGETALEIPVLEQLTLFKPDDPGAWYRLGLLKLISAPEAAAAALTRAAALAPAYQPAVETLRTTSNIARLHETQAGRLVIIGRGLGLVGEWGLAEQAMAQAIQIEPSAADAWAWLGEAKQQLGQDGRPELDRAIELGGGSATIRGLNALYWARAGDHTRALKEYSVAAELEPEVAGWQMSIGNERAQLGDLAAALSAFQRATELAPNDSLSWHSLAAFCLRNGVFIEDAALHAAQRAAELAPEDSGAQDVLGWAYLATGRLALSEQTLLKVLERDPEYAAARLHLAMTYLAQGASSSAQSHLLYIREAAAGTETGMAAEQLLAENFP